MQSMLLFLAATIAAPDAPAETTESPVAATAAKDDKANKVICRRRELTNTRMGSARPICMTKAGWDEARKISNKAAGTVAAHNGTNRTSEGISGMGLPPVPGGE